MKNIIHIFGASGSGTTTLGKKICEKLGYKHMDTDDYYWLLTEPKYVLKRPVEERIAMMKQDIEANDNVVISGSFAGWGDPLIPYITLAVRIEIDPEIRMERLLKREVERYGNRIEPDGDMYQHHLEFVEWAKSYDTGDVTVRSKAKHDEWQKQLSCEILYLDGTETVEGNLEKVKKSLGINKENKQ